VFVAEARVDLATAAREVARVAEHAASSTVAASTRSVLAGWHLNRFYSAVESLHERVAKTFDGQLPTGERWHMDLLDRMATDLGELRPAVITEGLRADLALYLEFRHVYRHIYRADLELEPMRHLLDRLESVHAAWVTEVERFLAYTETVIRDLTPDDSS
jgi:Uri superfamily endonuclease